MVKKIVLFNHPLIILVKFTTQKREKFQAEDAAVLTERLDYIFSLFGCLVLPIAC